MDCLHSLRPVTGRLCSICGEALAYAASADLEESARCGLCRLVPPRFERAVAYGSYEGALRDLVHLLKFGEVMPATQVLGCLLAEAIVALEPSLPAGTIVAVPVPLHANKQSQRGFNQAELIARAALKRLSRASLGENRFTLSAHALTRVRDTGSQIGRSREQRLQNLRGAFKVADATSIANRNVLVIDDVYTTGATASECARVLRRAGAAKVWVATVARTMRESNIVAKEFLQGQNADLSREQEENRLSRAAAQG